MSNYMVDYLKHLSGNNFHSLQVIRNFLYLILTRNIKYQLALYLWGAAGSGKSIFENIIQAISGKHVKSMTIKDLKDQHARVDLVNANVALFPDLKSYKGDVSELKNVISGDLIGARELYKNKINFRPNCIVIMTSNLLWQPNDSTNGIQRRFIYLTINKMPKNKNINLLNYEDNIASGILLNDLPGLINWALDADKEDLLLFNKSTLEINNMISPNLDKEVNPLLDWININVKYDENSLCHVGNKKTDKNKTLFPNYLEFCNNNGFTPLSIIDFSNSLIQQLNLLWDDKEITKKRTNSGVAITNTVLANNTNVLENYNDNNENNSDFNIYELLKDYIN